MEDDTTGSAITKTSSCRVYANSRKEIVQLGSSLGSVFLLFPMKVAGKNPRSPALSDSPDWTGLFSSSCKALHAGLILGGN